jgi:trans-2-enoyl-CoA reductase
MVTDFVSLQPGDVVLQNAGNSGVGLLVSQLATALFAAPVVSIVRRASSQTEEEFEELVHYLKTVGKNAMVVAEEDLLQDASAMKDFQSQLKELSGSGKLPRLALNAVGGASAELLLKAMEPGGTLVTYGGMSGEPVILATPQLIFKDVRAVGYWNSRWMVQHTHEEKQKMIDELVRAVEENDVQCPPARVFPIYEDVQVALQWQSNQGTAIRSKLVWDCREDAAL